MSAALSAPRGSATFRRTLPLSTAVPQRRASATAALKSLFSGCYLQAQRSGSSVQYFGV